VGGSTIPWRDKGLGRSCRLAGSRCGGTRSECLVFRSHDDAYRNNLNPAAIARQIADLQNRLLILAKEKTEQLYLASIPAALPDIRKGIRIKAS
jgi:hypothetical protein